MIMKFATKRDNNGNRYFIGLDTENRIFARESKSWFCREEIIEIGKRDLHKLQEQLEKAGFTRIENI